ncbi:hypothetical protein JTB14_025834 [Gonioctena quinquepunctata]|nr:hypothetical protein JTB14_025834 [Gonioctena quinquepunctata]
MSPALPLLMPLPLSHAPFGGGILNGSQRIGSTSGSDCLHVALSISYRVREEKRCLVQLLAFGTMDEWRNDRVLNILELYATERLLWDSSNNDHKMKHKVHDAWKSVSENPENTSIKELKSK